MKQTTRHKGIKKIVKEKSLRGNLEMLRIQKYHSAKQYGQLSQVTKTSCPIQGLGRREQAAENVHRNIKKPHRYVTLSECNCIPSVG